MKSIKCAYKNCNREAIGYFIGCGFGNWFCKKHKVGKVRTTIEEARNNPHMRWMFVEKVSEEGD